MHKGPELTGLGEAVKALWRNLHKVYPWLGTSDYVIMPDHVHLVLIVDFDCCPKFNPLVFIHWFMFQSERWLDLPMSPAQLKSIRHYIRLNPARALWKAKNPDCFIRRAIPSLDIRHSQAAAHGFRQNCLLMNEIAAALCNRQK